VRRSIKRSKEEDKREGSGQWTHGHTGTLYLHTLGWVRAVYVAYPRCTRCPCPGSR
jgi:hypothetical protein